MCEKYSTSADDIVLHIEAFLGNNSLEVLTLENFGKFEQELHRESTKVCRRLSCMNFRKYPCDLN